MKLLYSHDKNLKGGEIVKLGNGFPNLIINIEKTKKKQYQYNIDTSIDNEKINIKSIITKRKEEFSKPLLNLSESVESVNLIKRQEEYISNIKLNELKN